MERFDVVRSEEALTLSVPGGRDLLAACCSVLVTFFCVTVLWLIALLQEEHAPGPRGASEAAPFFQPLTDLSGYLFLLGFLLLLFLVPYHIVMARRPRLIFSFSRTRGLFLKNRRPVTPLRRIEYVLIRRIKDPDEAEGYDLVIVYLDGHEMSLQESYDLKEMRHLANEIADFVGVSVLEKPSRVRVEQRKASYPWVN